MSNLTVDDALGLAVQAHKDGNLKEADRLYTAILQVMPEHPDANHNLGLLAVNLGQLDNSIIFFEKALHANNKILQFWLSIIGTLVKLERFSDAYEWLTKSQQVKFKSSERKKIHDLIPPDFVLPKNVVHQQGEIESINKPSSKRSKKELKKSNRTAKGIKPKDPPLPRLQKLQLLYTQKKYQDIVDKAKRLLNKFPNSVALYNILGLTFSALEDHEDALVNFKCALKIKPKDPKLLTNVGNILLKLGDHDGAVPYYRQARQINPNSENASNALIRLLMIVAGHELSRTNYTAAISYYREILVLNPHLVDCHNNMGNALLKLGQPKAAIEYFNNTIKIKADFLQGFYNLGIAYENIGDTTEASTYFKKAIDCDFKHADSHSSLGRILVGEHKYDKALLCFDTAIKFGDESFATFSNKGQVLYYLRDYKAAIDSLHRALTVDNRYSDTYLKLANCYWQEGDIKATLNNLKSALTIEPSSPLIWDNVYLVFQAIKYDSELNKYALSILNTLSPEKEDAIQRSIFSYKLNRGTKDSNDALLDTLECLKASKRALKPIKASPEASKETLLEEDKKLVAMVHFGRSGTGLLHSLVDDHPEVSTMPSIYFSEFFSPLAWEDLLSGGEEYVVDNFISRYDILFDSSSKIPIATVGGKKINDLGQKEGLLNLGENRNEVLSINRDQFSHELKRRLAVCPEVNVYKFFLCVQEAYDVAIGRTGKQKIVFYHIHNPTVESYLNLQAHAPFSNWLVLVREPIQSCESWMKKSFNRNDLDECIMKVCKMLYTVDEQIYSSNKSIGVRLEDLKRAPEKTLNALCTWMGISTSEKLYSMTVQGKKWWGDPSSPDYEREGMDPFGDVAISRKLGTIFSDQDQFVLRTLFYPFNVKFKYIKEDNETFQKNLHQIRPLLEELFNFEKEILSSLGINQNHYLASGSSRLFRSLLIQRWDILEKNGTYPNMISPLEV